MLDESKLDLACFGDNRSHAVIDRVKGGGDPAMRDGLIGSTADEEADVFVTNERKLRNRMERFGVSCETWRVDDLKAYVGLAK